VRCELSAAELVEAIADGLMQSLRLRRIPPVNPFEIAERIGVTVRYGSLAGDGHVEFNHLDAMVTLNTRSNMCVQRFVLAHELCHVVLHDPDVAFVVQSAGIDLGREEAICQAFAGELMMPRRWVGRVVGPKDRSLAAVKGLADTAGVSLSAAHVRLSRVRRWRNTLLYFHRYREWTPLVLAGEPPRTRGAIHFCGTNARDIDALYKRSSRSKAILETKLDLQVRTQRITATAEVVAARSGLIALLPLAEAIAISRARTSAKQTAARQKA